MTLSGSWRSIERRPRAKVSPFFSFTGICVIPLIWYSTGASMVMILSSSFLISLSGAGGPGDQHHAIRLFDVAAEFDQVGVCEAYHVEREFRELLAHGFFIQHA